MRDQGGGAAAAESMATDTATMQQGSPSRRGREAPLSDATIGLQTDTPTPSRAVSPLGPGTNTDLLRTDDTLPTTLVQVSFDAALGRLHGAMGGEPPSALAYPARF